MAIDSMAFLKHRGITMAPTDRDEFNKLFEAEWEKWKEEKGVMGVELPAMPENANG